MNTKVSGVTINGPTTKDMDDAILIEAIDDRTVVTVSIAYDLWEAVKNALQRVDRRKGHKPNFDDCTELDQIAHKNMSARGARRHF